MRVCLVYDCLYPHTVGGAERWYRNLAEALAAEGHDVTYLTLRQWERGADPGVRGFEVVSAGPRMGLYTGGRRGILPPLLFGVGVLWHLGRRGGRYEVVHGAAPYLALLAAAGARRLHRYRLLVDWFEVWTHQYWREYLGTVGGWIGWRVQRLCARVGQQAFCFSRLHAERLRQEGFRGELTVLEGIYADGAKPAAAVLKPEPIVVFAGRHIPEKRAPALVPAVARAREVVPELRCEIYGDGPERDEVLRRIAALGLEGAVEAPGFVNADRVEQALARALCLVLPSRREGYGLVVVEAAAAGTPSVVVREPDNAATELIEEGENGFIAASAEPEALAAAILRVHEAGPELRRRTAGWFQRNAGRLSLASSLEAVLAAYGR